ncbi:MAG: DNA translocase FtsK [Coriobacteriia bacterium]
MASTSRGKKSTRSKASASRGSARSKAARKNVGLADGARREIAGVVLCALAIGLLIAVMSTQTGVAAAAIAKGLKYSFGIGAYIIPVFVMLWGVSFFVHSDVREARTGLGLTLVVLSVISIASLGLGQAALFEPVNLVARGGYVGGGVAWLLWESVGLWIGYVLLVALGIVGFVVTGLSISGIVERVRQALPTREPQIDRLSPESKRTPRTVAADAATVVLPKPRTGGEPTTRLTKTPAPAAAAVDPEASRKTMATTKAVAPRAMEGFVLPEPALLKRTTESAAKHKASDTELRSTAAVIAETLGTFDIPARVVHWVAGPTVTLFEVEIAKGVRLSRVTALSDDLALALASSTVRILAPIPGKSLVGIEVPNVRRTSVTLGDVLSPAGEGGPLTLAIGKDVAGAPILADLATMPHLLIGGTTGSGKSVAINAMLMSVLMRATPAEVRLILIDPKRVELTLYNSVPHLYVPVVTEPKEAASALAWSVSEMERRLKALQAAGARNIGGYNALVQQGKGPEGAEEMPYLVIVIDELADLMMAAAKEVEDSICRIAQLARAAGIHLIVATQRPEANIVTGLIKANITNRIAFNVASAIDSRVILDQPGAEKLVGLGDMLFSTPAWGKPKRIQGCFVSEEEIEGVVTHLKEQAEPDYHEEILHLKVAAAGGGVESAEDDDPLLWEAADIVVTSGLGSTSMLQRRLKVGYARAGRIMDMLEMKGIVGPPDGSKPREVVVDVEGLESIKVFEREEAEGRA